MTDVHDLPALDPLRFVSPGALPQREPLLRFGLHLSDRPLVAPGQRVELRQPIIGRFRDQEIVEIPTTAAVVGMHPGDVLDQVPIPQSGRRARRGPAETYRARVLEHGRDGITRLVAASGEGTVLSPLSGFVEALVPGRLDIRAEGLAVSGQVAWGRPSGGSIVIAAEAPDAETRATNIDAGVAGAILVVGSRIDIEAISKARAIGVAAIVSGGVAGHDMRQLAESELRQRAALQGAAPFAFIALGGYGRAGIPRHLWDLLVAAAGRPAGVMAESRQLIIGGDPVPLLSAATRAAGTVRVAGGERRDQEGRLVGLSGPRRWPGGAYAPGGFVEMEAADGILERVCLPLSSLERLG